MGNISRQALAHQQHDAKQLPPAPPPRAPNHRPPSHRRVTQLPCSHQRAELSKSATRHRPKTCCGFHDSYCTRTRSEHEDNMADVKPESPAPRGEKLEAQIKSADMTEDMQSETIEVAQEAMAKFTIEKDIAQHIKRTFDERKGPTWHCIVGRNFGSFVTHETKHFIYFYLGHCAILLFKTQ